MEDYMKNMMNYILDKCNSKEIINEELKAVEGLIKYDENEIEFWNSEIEKYGQDDKRQYFWGWKNLKEILLIHEEKIKHHIELKNKIIEKSKLF